MWVYAKVLNASNFLPFCDLDVVAHFERLVLEIDSSSTNPELRKHRRLEFIVVDLPN
jgi:hypothetical protein